MLPHGGTCTLAMNTSTFAMSTIASKPGRACQPKGIKSVGMIGRGYRQPGPGLPGQEQRPRCFLHYGSSDCAPGSTQTLD